MISAQMAEGPGAMEGGKEIKVGNEQISLGTR